MKKQFFRVKQLADQTFSRAGKTEVLSDDLQEADRHVEYIRTACHKTSKNLSSGLITQGQDPAAKDKRLKKYPEYLLSVAMQESSAGNDEFLLGAILAKCGKVERELANEAFNHEVNVEQRVVTPLNEIIDNEVSNILKHKRNLQKLILDMDSARARHAAASKQSSGQQRMDSIREELEEAELKVEQCRDMLASDMFMLISKEATLAESVILHVKLQKEYHKSVLSILEEVIPELEADINDSQSKPVYHFPLEEHLRVTGRKIAFPVELCVCALIELGGLNEEGLFRVAGGTGKVRRMKLSFDAGCLNYAAALEYRDPHVIAGALKSYLRELPEPLMTSGLYAEWMAAAKIAEPADARLNALWNVLHKLPEANMDNLRYLVKFLAELTKCQGVNKMTPQNVAIVIAPNLIWSPNEESTNIGMNMNMANMYSSIVDTLITYCDWFFPGENQFFLTWQPMPSREKEASQVNGMSKSVGPLSTITHQDDIDYYGHVRSGSSDTNLINVGEDTGIKRTQSNSSLSDSPPHGGSPKPATRRKNKPAPVPPASIPQSSTPEKPPRPAVPPAVTTLPRPAKKPLDEGKTFVSPAVSESAKFVSIEKQTRGVNTDPFGYQERANPLRRSADSDPKSQENKSRTQGYDAGKSTTTKENENFKLPDNDLLHRQAARHPTKDHLPDAKAKPPNVSTRPPAATKADEPAARLIDAPVDASSDKPDVLPHPSSTILIPTTVNALVGLSRVTVNAEQPFQMSGSSTLDRKRRPMPVAAPRTSSLAETKEGSSPPDAASKLEGREEGGEGVTMRRPSVEGDRANKPAIPERPTTLQRPLSTGFKTPRNSAELDALPDAERPSLERIHMYCVDKQQVSIIQVGGCGAEREKDKTAAAAAEPVTAAEPLSALSDSKAERPERPPKPEHIHTSATPPVPPPPAAKPPSHARALSEGNIIDPDKSQPPPQQPPSPGGPNSRPPRPQPPPPPPPVKPRGEGGPSESTDL